MSKHGWHDYGVGVRIGADSADITEEQLHTLVAMAPNFQKEFEEWEHGMLENGASLQEIIDEFEDDIGEKGIPAILFHVIDECEEIPFAVLDDFENEHYIIYTEKLPWQMSEQEKNLTSKEDIEKILDKYTGILSGLDENAIEFGFLDVENFC